MVHRPSSACGLVAAMLALSCTVQASDAYTPPKPPPFTFLDLRIGTGTTEAPNVTEKVTSSSGVTSIDWGDSKSSPRASLLVLGGWSYDNTGPVFGLETSFTRYSLGSSVFGATDVHLTQQSGMLLAGWQYGITQSPELHGHVEITPMYGALLSFFDRGEANHIIKPEYGIRGGVFASERRVTAGVVAAWIRSSGSLTTTTGDGLTSEIQYEIKGYRLSFEVGYRF